MSRAPGGMREVVPHTRRERVANYGDTVNVVSGGLVTVCDHTGERGSSLLLTVECEKFFIPPGGPLGNFRPYVRIAWGHGATSVSTDVEVTRRQMFPVAASGMKVQAFIKSLPLPGTPLVLPAPVPDGAFAKFRAFLCEGIDARGRYATRWVSQVGVASGVLATTQARIAHARATNPGAASFLLFFDSPVVPAGGTVPDDFAAIPANLSTPVDFGQTRAFVTGLSWGVSSTVLTYTPAAVNIALAAELEQ
ncbi:MAG: hypothetical protein ACHP7H_00805 [Hyphomicrobiales bacterium]